MVDKRFVIIILSYLLFFILIPPFQIPDESEHYENAYWLTKLKYPHLPPGKYVNNSPLFISKLNRLYDVKKITEDPFVLPNFNKIKESNQRKTYVGKEAIPSPYPISNQAYHPPVYAFFVSIFFRITNTLRFDVISQFYFNRMTSAFFYILMLFMVYKILRLIIINEEVVKNLLLVFAINPLILRIGIGINTDIAVLFFSSVFLYVFLKFQKENSRFDIKQICILSIIASAATLSKFSGIFTGIFLSIFLLIKNKFSFNNLKKAMLFWICFGVLTSPWFMLNITRYNNPLIDNFSLICKRVAPMNPIKAVFSGVLEFRHAIMHYAGFMGWEEIYPFKWFFIGYTLVFLFFVITGLFKIITVKRQVWKLMLIYVFSLILILFILGSKHKIVGLGCDIQGRYLSPVFLPLITIITYGVSVFFKNSLEKTSRYLCYFALFHFYFVLFLVLIARYYV